MASYSSWATQFYHDNKGQLRFFQHFKQGSNGFYSFTNYDAPDRVLEGDERNGGATRATPTAPIYSAIWYGRSITRCSPVRPSTMGRCLRAGRLRTPSTRS